MTSYPKPKHEITNAFNPLDFFKKESTVKQATSGNDIAEPKIDNGVVYYDTTDNKLHTDSSLTYNNTTKKLNVGNIGINCVNPLARLSIDPFFWNQTKIVFFDGNDANAVQQYSIGMTANQLNNHIHNNADYVWYSGGKNGPGTGNGVEIMRLNKFGFLGLGINPTSKLHVDGNVIVIGNENINGNLGVSLKASVGTLIQDSSSALTIVGNTKATGDLNLTGNENIIGNLNVSSNISSKFTTVDCETRVLSYAEGSASIITSYPLIVYSVSGTNGVNHSAIGFSSNNSTNNSPGASIQFLRTGPNSQGTLNFKAKINGNLQGALEDSMIISSTGVSFPKGLTTANITNNGAASMGVLTASSITSTGNINSDGIISSKYCSIDCANREMNMNENISTVATEYPFLISASLPTSTSTEYDNKNICCLAFASAHLLNANSPGACLSFVRTGNNSFGNLTILLKSSTNPIGSLTPVIRYKYNRIESLIPYFGLFCAPTALVTTGSTNISNAINYPLHIYSTVGGSGQRAAIAFNDNSSDTTTQKAAADIVYQRTDATNDIGQLHFNLSVSATQRDNILSLQTSKIEMKKNCEITGNLGVSLKASVGTLTADGTNTLTIVGTTKATGNVSVIGNIGINTTTPNARLSIDPNEWNQTKIVFFDSNNASALQHYAMGMSALQFNFHIHTDADYVWYGGGKNGPGTGGTERLRLTKDGRMGLGLTSPTVQLDLSTDGARKLTSAAWTTGSDRRLKDDIQDADLDLCYATAKNIKIRYFKWKDELFNDEEIGNDRHKIGFIAQEIEGVFPKSTTKSKEPMRGIEECMSLNNEQIYHTFFGAFQKMMQKVESLESTNSLMLDRITSLETELNNLKNNI